MMRTVFTILATPILGLMLCSQAGCLLAAAAAGTGATVAYVSGDLETSVNASPRQVAEAAERAMKDLDIAVIAKEASGLDGTVVGRTARDVKITVVIKGQSEKLSKISVRAGVFGDDSMQTAVLEKIKHELGESATTPVN